MTLPLLKPGDTIGVMAPSSYIEREDIEKSALELERRGYKVFIHPQTYERENQSAGNVLQKSLAFQGLWQREDINAIWAAGGGNRAGMLLESINFEKMQGKQKPVIGFSDVTPLLNAVYRHCEVCCIHGPVFKQLHSHRNLDETLAVLGGESLDIPMEGSVSLSTGEAKGKLFGGCLSPFLLLPQTKDCPDLDGAILFLEDTGEEISRIDRMFLHLRRLGVFEQISGLVLGEFHDLQDSTRPFGYSLGDIVQTHINEYDIPAVLNVPFGHGQNLYPLPIGVQATLHVRESEARLAF